jgi:ketosteroid isomerase-like protein
MRYWDRTHNRPSRGTCSIETRLRIDTPDTGNIEARHKMDKSETHAVLRQDTKWTNQRHMQYWEKTQNGQFQDRGSIETRHRMDKPETQAVLGRETEWADQSHKKHWDKTQNGQTRDTGSFQTRKRMDKPETQAVLREDT